MTGRTMRHGIGIDTGLATFVEAEGLPGTGIGADTFRQGMATLLRDFGPRNRALLENCADLQARIDAWHIARRDRPHDHAAYKSFLHEIGYLLPEGDDFAIETTGIDPEWRTARPAASPRSISPTGCITGWSARPMRWPP